MPSLYHLSSELAAIFADAEAELSEETAQRLAELEIAFDRKVEAVLQYRQGLISDREALKGELARLKERADRLDRQAEWLKTYILETMKRLNVGRVSTLTFNATVAKSPPAVKVATDAVIPEEFKRTKVSVEVDKTAVLEAWKNKQPLPDGFTVAQGEYLKIS